MVHVDFFVAVTHGYDDKLYAIVITDGNRNPLILTHHMTHKPEQLAMNMNLMAMN